MSRREDEPEHYLHLPAKLDAGDLSAAVARGLVGYFSEPENLAGISGSVLLLLIVSRGRHMPLIPALMVSGMGQLGGRMAYRSYRNLEIIAQAAQAQAGDA